MATRLFSDFDCLAALRALGEPSRMKIVRRLLEGPHAVGELGQALGMPDYNTSRHLTVLRTAGLVRMQKSAQQRIYELSPAFQKRLSKGGRILDLGCCTFDFDQLPD